MKIAVLMGGTSAEREVSLASGQGIVKALRERGHEVWTVDTARGYVPPEREADLLPEGVHAAPPGELDDALEPIQLAEVEQIRAADVAFLALHGGAGEDGTIQALLDLMGVRYTGSGPLGSGIAMDKDVSKRLFRDAQVPTLPWRVARAPDFRYDPDTIEDLIGFPCIVKPSKQGSSVGISVVTESDQLAPAVEDARQYDSEVMIERYAKGRELTVGILGDQALPPVDLRLPQQVHAGDDRVLLPGAAGGGGGGADAGVRAAGLPRAEAPRLRADRLHPGPRAALLPGGQHPAGDDRHQPPSQGRRGRGDRLSGALRADRTAGLRVGYGGSTYIVRFLIGGGARP